MPRKKIVTLGGGTGHFRLIEVLREMDNLSITSIVAMTDSGGSSGRLRDEHGVMPPGDLRNCLLAHVDDPILKNALNYRFPPPTNGTSTLPQNQAAHSAGQLKDHPLGNLFLVALEMSYQGKFIAALNRFHDFCGIPSYHRVLPITIDKAHIQAKYSNGVVVTGETHIDLHRGNNPLPILQLSLSPNNAGICPESADAIRDADIIIFSPGSIFTSTAAVLLPIGTRESILESKAHRIFICNVMTQPGESSGPGLDGSSVLYRASDFVAETEKYAGVTMDIVICNNVRPDQQTLDYYARYNSFFVEPDLLNQANNGRTILCRDLISPYDPEHKLARHDTAKLRQVLNECFKTL